LSPKTLPAVQPHAEIELPGNIPLEPQVFLPALDDIGEVLNPFFPGGPDEDIGSRGYSNLELDSLMVGLQPCLFLLELF